MKRFITVRRISNYNIGQSKPGSSLQVPEPKNEPNYGYMPGSLERNSLISRIEYLKKNPVEVPLLIGGQEIKTQNVKPIRCPHDHSLELGVYHVGGEREVKLAIEAAIEAKSQWNALPPRDRIAVFLKMAELLRTEFRSTLNAATMLGQGKNIFQAEIDSASEFIDFLNFNTHFAQQIYQDQPISSQGVWNRMDYRPLEGFIFAVSPFNFTAIAGNLACAPAMMGNTIVWKPSDHAMLSGYYLTRLYKAAGLPDGVINMVNADPVVASNAVLEHRDFGGLHFTGSSQVFKGLWKTIGDNINKYKSYPRIVGETGGKDFIFAHSSSDVKALSVAIIRGSFEYQGQKCSAASRAYIPKSIWGELEELLVSQIKSLQIGDITDPKTMVGAVIHEASFNKLSAAIETIKKDPSCKILCGGKYDKSIGWFVQPTLVLTTDPNHQFLKEELFGPLMMLYVYDDKNIDEALKFCNDSQYSLTGSIFGQDRVALRYMEDRLLDAAGNFYINDKPTGAVIGQQPFGGGRLSGTNDKAGSYANLLRWTNLRTVKETFNPPHVVEYPYMK